MRAARAPLPDRTLRNRKRRPRNRSGGEGEKTGRHASELALLAAYGITGQIAEDFLTIRKAKRQPLTETAARLIAADAEKCGMTALQAAEYAIASGWGSFRADWLQNKTFGRSGNRGGDAQPNRRRAGCGKLRRYADDGFLRGFGYGFEERV
ncbi:hypothetical protein [Neisseria gonorrhoeae]|uniref:hypothetical protein n=1 Tax=Neisseria gonorrhoeae TaxID=485 RepID=UPI00387B957A